MDIYAGHAAVQRPIHDQVAELLTLSSIPDEVRRKAEQFLTVHYPLEDDGSQVTF
jgi:hypothetical protein